MTITRLLTKAAVMLLLAILGLTPSYAQSQKATLVREGESIGFYYGADALKSAVNAAAASGDIIVLTSGTFNWSGETNKSFSLYGQGWEDESTRTTVNGKLCIRSNGPGSLNGIHLEGIYFTQHLDLLNDSDRNPITNFTVVKCRTSGFYFYMPSENIQLQQCLIQGTLASWSGNHVATNFVMENCWKEGSYINFPATSTITIRNSIMHYRYINGDGSNFNSMTTYENCIIANATVSGNSSLDHCVLINSTTGTTLTDCWTGLNYSDVFAETGVTSAYVAGVVPTVQSQFVGTDNTLIGITGGTLGWDTQTTTIAPDLETTLTKDDEGYYQLASVADWVEFARIVAIDNTVYGRMTANIDLGNDQTMVGDGYYPNANQRVPFRGIFDGQGHTLTVNYVTANLVEKYTNAGLSVPGYLGCAPFGYVWNGTIRNLHTAGTITATHEGVAGIVGWTNGSVLIENCHSSVDITFTDGHRGAAGITYDSYNDSHVLTINDCVYDGTLTAGTNKTGSAGFVVYRPYGTVNINNSLLAATYGNGLGTNDCATFVRNPNGVISYSYFQTALGTVQGSQATATELANGRTAFYLQNGRTDLVWGQLIGTDPLPILTNDESRRVYRSANGYTNNPDEAIPDQSLQPFLYTRDNQNNLTITGFDPGFTPPTNYALVIPDEIDGAPVTAIANNAFQNKTNFVSLTVGNNVATIGQSAFASCTALTTVNLPDNGALTTMNNGVFEGCTTLTSLVIPNTVTTLGEYMLRNCTAMTSVTISNQVTILPFEMFRNCQQLNNVLIPGSVTEIRNNVFVDCKGLTSIVIPNSVTTMGTSVFTSCTSLATATFETGCQLTTIPDNTFNGCTALTAFTVPASVTTIGVRTFGNSGLTSITFPANVTNINGYAFEYCASLTDITLPATITTLNGSVFYRSGVQTATIYCASIANNLFDGCSKLETLIIGDGVTTIGVSAFNGCSKLATVNIPASVNSIGGYAFANTPLLETVTIAAGSTLQTIPNNMFQNATKLDGFVIPASVTTISNNAFEGCTSLTSLVIPNTVTTLGEYMLKNCTAMTSVTISSQVTILPSDAFRNCQQLDNVVIPSSVTEIRSNVFVDCKALTSIVIPNSVTTMGNSVFTSCTSLATATFETGCQLTTIPDYTFNGCTALTTFTVPASVTTIGTSAFYNCTLLASVSLPQGLTTINNNAFRFCSSLNNVVLPGTLTSIKEWSFANCTSMENLTIEEGVTSINHDVFQYSGMKNVVLPSTLGAIGINLFYQCNQLQTLDVSKCVNVWELYYYTSLRGNNTIFYGVPTTTKIILPPYAQATLGPNDEIATLTFDLTADTDGYYLINNATDWEKFAVYSRLRPTLNARLTADISLTAGNARLGIGNFDNTTQNLAYQGSFDGQRHTITVDFNFPNRAECLFMWVNNASIYRLKVAGTIRTQAVHTGGIIRSALGSITIEDCESAVNIIGTPTTVTNLYMGGFIGHGHNAQIYMTDCLFTGSITGIAKHRYASAFLGWMESAGRITYNYCLNNGTFTNLEVSNTYALGITPSNGQTTVAACYYKAGNNITNNENLATAVSSDQLTSGQTTYRLQGGREEQHWGQIIGTDPAPRLTDEEGTRVYRGQTYTNEPTAYTGLLQDEDGYYLISSTVDWEEFALLTKDLPLSNARMTNDVTVVDNTMIGDVTTPYSGIFDGQGYTLTINYDRTGLAYSQSMDYGAAPFLYIQNATIKNLHVDGSIHTSTKFAAGVVGDVKGSQSLIENCRSSVNITSSVNGEGCMGGVVSHMTNGHTVFIRDCHFDGSFDAPNAWGNGGIMGYKNGTATIENCLFAPSALSSGSSYSYCIMRQGGGTTTINNCYYTQQLGSVQGTLANAEQLASGYTAYKLQNRRDELVWGQTIGTHPQPVLVVFDNTALRVYRFIDGYSNNPDAGVLPQDGEGYYLISSVSDWQALAMLVDEGENDAYARMTADIDLGNDQTMVGSGTVENNDGTGNVLYQGIFDGQGHTLTIHYQTNEIFCAPFRHIKNATIKNLHVAGSINTSNRYAAGIVGNVYGQQIHSYVTNCVSSVNITSSYVNNGNAFYDSSYHGGIVARLWYYGQLHITDCLFNGSIGGENIGVTWGGMLGVPDGTVTIQNCLQAGTFDCTNVTSGSNGSGTFSTTFGSGYASLVNVSYCYYVNALGNVQGTQASPTTLADGTVTTALQANRTEEIWVQDPVTNQPMLKTFISLTHLTQDADGYYLLGSVQDWQDFATLVQTMPTANAKMTADIDLGDDQTMVGTYAVKYQGTFDGQGHTLTINYNTSGMTIESPQQYLGAAPFRDIQNATIRNLHTAGTVTADKIGATGLVGWAYGENTIERCWSSVDIVSSNNTADTFSGFVFRQDGSLLTMNDCFYSGKIQSVAKKSHAGFVGHHTAGTAILNNCLVIFAEGTDVPATTDQWTKCYTFVRDQDQGKVITLNYCYYKTAFGTPQGTQATIQQLANGTTAAALQAGRSEIVWVQDLETNQPMLKIFTLLHQDNEGYYLLGSLQNWKDFAELVQTTPGTYNARMTADIDLGDDQTMLGSFATPYAGIFDGQGHTLTIHYNTSGMTIESGQGYLGAAPFRDINGATIRNLHTAGTVTADKIGATGMVGWAYGACVIERCCVSVNITATAGDTFSGFVFRQDGTSLQINDCIFNGSIMPSEKHDHGGFVGHAYNGQTTVNNCLMLANCNFNGTSCYVFVRTVGNHNGTFTINNSYYQTFNGTPQGTQVTATALADGTVATALQAGRQEIVWVQDPVTNQPMLALFSNNISFDGDGSEDNPFIITTTAELDYLAFLVNGVTNFYGKYFKLGADIEYNPNVLTIDNNGDGVNDSNYTPIGNGFYIGNNGSYPFEIYSFQGYFDGDGHTISGIRIYRDGNTNDDKFQGIFGFLSDYSRDDSFNTSVCNLTVTDTDITGFKYIGGVFGENDERVTIENCHVANNVVLHVIQPGSQCIGGIAGFNFGNVAHCSSAVTITVTSNASNDFNTNQFGGLVGANHGILANNLVIGATIPIANTYNTYYGTAGEEYGAILGWATDFSITRHNYYSACTVAGVPNATNVGCGDTFGAHDLNDNNGAVPGYLHNVTGYGNSTESDHWALIASPVTTEGGIAPTAVGNLIADPVAEYDLYRFNQSASKEWENYKNPTHTAGFTLENGKGYLYANKNNVTLAFAGTINTDNEMTVDLAYEDGVELAGYNLVGNPFLTEAVINRNYYTMNAQGTGIVAEEVNASEPIPPFTGVIVQATGVNQSVTFTKATRQSTAPNQGNLQIAVAQANTRDNAIEDNAIVSFNEGSRLGKFYFGNPRANIYIPKSHEEYAIAYSDGHGEMPINFRANENGQYTITVNPENVEMAYLHLIDNMTGADVDLLQTPEYTFNAKVTDYESRFKLVFVAKDIDGPSTGSGTFAFIDASGNIIITADAFDASLQVIDAMGRVLVCRDARRASAISTTGMAPGVYVLRLISGEDVKVQKIVVR